MCFALSMGCLAVFLAACVLLRTCGPARSMSALVLIGVGTGLSLAGCLVSGYACIRRSRKATLIAGVIHALLGLAFLAILAGKLHDGDVSSLPLDLLAPVLCAGAAVLGITASQQFRQLPRLE